MRLTISMPAFVRSSSLARLLVSSTIRVQLSIVKAECGVGVEGVEAVVLQLICSHLVGETKPAAFLRQIENDAAAEVFEQRHSEPKLVPAVPAPRAEHVARQ